MGRFFRVQRRIVLDGHVTGTPKAGTQTRSSGAVGVGNVGEADL